VNNSGTGDHIGIFAPGSGLNISPNTTTIVNPALISYTQNAQNYHWAAVTSAMDPSATNFDLDAGGQTDYFLSFSVPFADILAQLAARGIVANENTPFSYVISTSTQGNSLNQDLNGVGPGYNTSSTWASLGVLTDGTPPISVVPEANTMLSVVALVGAVVTHSLLLRRRQRARAIAATRRN
jgi:hypothetical protein